MVQIRHKVILEENRAELTIHEVERKGAVLRVAHIDIPSFYMESEEKAQGLEYQSTTLDVQRLLGEMADVDGLSSTFETMAAARWMKPCRLRGCSFPRDLSCRS